MNGVDARLGREAQDQQWAVSIGLNMNPDKPRWSFMMLYDQPGPSRKWMKYDSNDPCILILDGPIGVRKKKQIEKWIYKFCLPEFPKLRYVHLCEAALAKVQELQEEEKKLRSGHKFVQRFMAKQENSKL